MTETEHSSSVVWSTFTGAPDEFFDGYCFVDADYVFGESGMREYQQAKGRRVARGEDGCYVSVTRSRDAVEIGTDAAGLRKLFYFSRDGVWGVSDSLVDLAEHLRANGVRLTANFPQLAGFMLDDTIAKQLASFGTMFNEIRMLPSFSYVRISQCGLEVVDTEVPEPRDYREALTEFVNTWVSRMETMLGDERMKISVDLTGGVDSRVNFALLVAASRRCGVPLDRVLVKSSKGPRWSADLAAATTIAQEYGVVLNKRPWRERAPALDPVVSYQRWRSSSLGVYRPMYPPAEQPLPFYVSVHGGGGESHRTFYEGPSAAQYLDDVRATSAHPLLAEHWARDVLVDLEHVGSRYHGVPPLVAHYREFRGRLHGGRSAHDRVTMAPLSSRDLPSPVAWSRDRSGAQVNFDIMESLVPGLADLPFDSERKALTPDERRSLTHVTLSDEPRVGAVYAQEESQKSLEGKRHDHGPWIDLLDRDLQSARRTAVEQFAGKRVLSRAVKVLDNSRREGQIHKPREAMNLSSIVAIDSGFRVCGL